MTWEGRFRLCVQDGIHASTKLYVVYYSPPMGKKMVPYGAVYRNVIN